MKTTRNEALKLEHGIPASTMLRFVLARAGELEDLAGEMADTAGRLDSALGDGEARRRFGGVAAAAADVCEAVSRFGTYLDESGLRDAGERVG